jgi:8-oxo-dGDP phosphatase
MAESSPGEFKKLGERDLHEWFVGRLAVGEYESPTGETFTRTIVRAKGAVSVVPIIESADGPQVVLIRQYRPSVHAYVWEVPAGMRDVPGEDPAETGRRELIEEAGFTAESLELLTVFYPAVGLTDHTHHVYLATGLTHVGSETIGPEEEFIEIVPTPLGDALRMVWTGEISVSSAVIGLLMAGERLGVSRSDTK